ncbi:hypothetical protein AB0J83_30900 [Actinoplanes sp. NPDC049596]|uniref:hypothetical protein n=1 Tax=unclassified Actinoplanes TaxID=2626549 RepID=UPI0034372CBF
MSHMTRGQVLIIGLAATLSLAVAAATGSASWIGLTRYAEQINIRPAWVLFVMLDGLMILATVALAAAPHIAPGRQHRWPWAIIYTGTILSAFANAVAADTTMLGRAWHALTPCVLAVTVHVFFWILDRTLNRSEQVAALTVVGQPPTATPASASVGVTHEATPAFLEAAQATPVSHGLQGSSMENPAPTFQAPVERDPESEPPVTAGLPTPRPAIYAVPSLPADNDPVTQAGDPMVHDPQPTAHDPEPVTQATDPEQANATAAPAVTLEPVGRASIIRDICERWAAQTPPRIASPADWRDLLAEDDRLAAYTRPDKAIGNAVGRWLKTREKIAA